MIQKMAPPRPEITTIIGRSEHQNPKKTNTTHSSRFPTVAIEPSDGAGLEMEPNQLWSIPDFHQSNQYADPEAFDSRYEETSLQTIFGYANTIYSKSTILRTYEDLHTIPFCRQGNEDGQFFDCCHKYDHRLVQFPQNCEPQRTEESSSFSPDCEEWSQQQRVGNEGFVHDHVVDDGALEVMDESRGNV